MSCQACAHAAAAAAFEEEFSFAGVPRAVLDALRARDERTALQRAVAAGFRDENTLTDLVFYARHPERQGAALRREETTLAREWLDIRDRLVRASARPAPAPARAAPVAGGADIVSVRGIQVARQIAGQVDALLAAAQAEGVSLSGSGWRDPQRQIALRRQNCGPTPYDIHEKPASQCNPPTARPGTSLHERGLAIDFRYAGGNDKKFRDTPGFPWMQRNAARFGLYNLPSEPWHWSTTGG